MRIVLWMNISSHHQSDFFNAIYEKNPDFKVVYYGEPIPERNSIGWIKKEHNKDYEISGWSDLSVLSVVPHWRQSIHVVPGYGSKFLISLVRMLSSEDVDWVHWSEKSSPGLKWMISIPIKLWYAFMVNKYARVALAISLLAEYDFIKWGIKSSHISFLPYSIHCVEQKERDKEIMEFKKDKKAFVYVGSVSQKKGIDILLKAFCKAIKGIDDWCLILVGDDRENGKYCRMVKRYGIENMVLFRGVVKSNNIGAVYSCTDVFVLPSRYDGWGMVVNEAASYGLPLIISDAAGASWHLVDNGINGIRYKSNSKKALALAMSRYIEHPEMIKHQGIYSKKIFNSHSSDVMANRFLEIIRNSWSEN